MSAPGAGAGWQSARRILCVRLDSLGELLMSTPALRVLRAAVPGRTLTLLGSPAGVAALPFIPELDDAIAYAAPWTGPAPARAREADLALVETLAARAFDAAVIFTGLAQSPLPAALLCHLAGIPLRLAHCRDKPYGLLTDWILDPEPATLVRHEVVRQLALVKHAGAAPAARDGAPGLSFALDAADVRAVHRHLHRAGINANAPWLLLHPGAGAAARRYLSAHWAQVARLLARSPALPLVFTGSQEEAGLIESIRTGAGVAAVSLAGQLTLGELGAALKLATLAVTNNAAPVHIAAALGTPVVDLYALTHPQQTPWNVPNRVLFHDVACRFCHAHTCPAAHHACLAGVAPERVVDAVQSLLRALQRRPHLALVAAPDTQRV